MAGLYRLKLKTRPYDHRVVDGAEAAQFLVRVKELIEDPEAWLPEG